MPLALANMSASVQECKCAEKKLVGRANLKVSLIGFRRARLFRAEILRSGGSTTLQTPEKLFAIRHSLFAVVSGSAGASPSHSFPELPTMVGKGDSENDKGKPLSLSETVDQFSRDACPPILHNEPKH